MILDHFFTRKLHIVLFILALAILLVGIYWETHTIVQLRKTMDDMGFLQELQISLGRLLGTLYKTSIAFRNYADDLGDMNLQQYSLLHDELAESLESMFLFTADEVRFSEELSGGIDNDMFEDDLEDSILWIGGLIRLRLNAFTSIQDSISEDNKGPVLQGMVDKNLLTDVINMDSYISRLFDLRLEFYHQTNTKKARQAIQAQLTSGFVAIFLLILIFMIIIVQQRRSEKLAKAYREEGMKSEALAKAKSTFLANMSHEIRTPLNAIIGFSELLNNPDLSREKYKAYIKGIQRGSRNLLLLINDILDLSKIDAGKLDFVEERISVRELFSDLNSMFLYSMEKKGIQLRYSLDSEYSYIYSDGARLRQILLNLIGNAVKFTEKGFVEFTFTTLDISKKSGADHRCATAVFTVSDSGIGINSGDLEAIFQSFKQLSSGVDREYGGTGLGLSISQRLAMRLGGELNVESVRGRGSSFIVRLPETTVERESGMSVEEGDQDSHAPYDIGGLKVLIADDEEDNREIFRVSLEEFGANADVSRDGKECLEALSSGDYDLLVLDLRMPKLSGMEVLEKMPDLPRNSGIPVLLVTASVGESEYRQYLNERIRFLQKPATHEQFRSQIARMTGRVLSRSTPHSAAGEGIPSPDSPESEKSLKLKSCMREIIRGALHRNQLEDLCRQAQKALLSGSLKEAGEISRYLGLVETGPAIPCLDKLRAAIDSSVELIDLSALRAALFSIVEIFGEEGIVNE